MGGSNLKDKALEIFNQWDIGHMDDFLDKDEFKRLIEEENDEIINPIIRDLEEDGLIEVERPVGTFWKIARITGEGRRSFPNSYLDDILLLVLKTVRDYDYENTNQYISKQNLKTAINEDNDEIINRVLRDLEFDGLIDVSSSISDRWQSVKISKMGRDSLKEKNI